MLCFCLVSKQACAGDAWDYDLPNFQEVHKFEPCANDDANQPIVLVTAYVYFEISEIIQQDRAEKFYLQPDIHLLLRPPAV